MLRNMPRHLSWSLSPKSLSCRQTEPNPAGAIDHDAIKFNFINNLLDFRKSLLAQDYARPGVRSSLTNRCRQDFTEILQFAALPTFATQRFGCAPSAIVRGTGVAQVETTDSAQLTPHRQAIDMAHVTAACVIRLPPGP
jgi:hypothetical protein